ncbi:MAG: serine hydroxymethyltransferase [Candidatus Asgardarchaeia archaeon]
MLKDTKLTYDKIFELLQLHHSWMQKTINLIASENIPSPAVREAIVTDLGNRYAEGWPGERVYAGCKYLDEIEIIAQELTKELFKAGFADVRPISGVVANLVVYTAFTNPGDRMMALSIPTGGHISMARSKLWGTAGKVHGLDVQYFVFDEKEFTIDVDKTIKKVKKMEAEGKHIHFYMLGASVFLFPHPVKEISELAKEYNAYVNYDASHVAGLIAGGKFQDPLREGVDSMSFSTHKTLPGPQHGTVVLPRLEDLKITEDEYEERVKRIKKASFPGLLSNHHLHNVAGLAVALSEMLEFGPAYAEQIIKNAKALGDALYNRGFDVLAADKGFTESHTLIVDVSKTPLKDGGVVEKTLEQANIIINRNLLPWDIREGRDYKHPSGIRLGTSELTRLGMKESDMDVVAEFIKRVVIDKEKPAVVAKEVEEFRKAFQKCHYCFENATDAYKYIHIR